MAVTEAQARRAVRGIEFQWDGAVRDPRSARNQRHGHHGILSALAGALACGLVQLRAVEDFTEDLGTRMRKRLGLAGRVSDSTFYRVLSGQETTGLRETLYRQVRELIDRKSIRSTELFPFGVLSIDGKCCWASTSSELEGAKQSEDPNTGLITSSLTSLRSVLTSSSLTPCLDMEFIAQKSGESPAFRTLLPRVCRQFGGQFDIVTVDAGMTCRENALVVRGQDKHFLMTLKGNQHKLHSLVVPLFESAAQRPRLHDDELRNGARVYRELYTVKFEDLPEEVRFPEVREVWCVRQLSEPVEGSSAKSTAEVRFFVSSMPSKMLTPTQKLALVRLHWGIENGHHWTLDVPLREDSAQPCQATRAAIEVVAWLRTIAFNLITAWRARASSTRTQRLSWKRSMQLLRDAILHPAAERYLATLG